MDGSVFQVMPEFIDWAIAEAQEDRSKLPEWVLKRLGGSSPKGRHLQNNLCAGRPVRYLEVGVWLGTSLLSSGWGNQGLFAGVDDISFCTNYRLQTDEGFMGEYVSKEVAIDFTRSNWHFALSHLSQQGIPAIIVEGDCFELDHSTWVPADVFYYDGDHSTTAQEKGITHFADLFADQVLLLVDDFDLGGPQKGTAAALRKIPFRVVYERYIPSHHLEDMETWWNGYYVALLERTHS